MNNNIQLIINQYLSTFLEAYLKLSDSVHSYHTCTILVDTPVSSYLSCFICGSSLDLAS